MANPNQMREVLLFVWSKNADEANISSKLITKTRLFKYIDTFTSKNWKFSDTKILIFFICLLKT